MPRGRVGAVVVLGVFSAAGSVLVGGIAGLPSWVDGRADSIVIGRA
jgi:hypothetical protein